MKIFKLIKNGVKSCDKNFNGAIHTTLKMKFSIKDFPNSQETADFVTFTEGILKENLIFCAVPHLFIIFTSILLHHSHT